MGKILLIEDDATFSLVLSRLLRQTGHSVQTAEDGNEGLELYRREPPDLIIMDIYMPQKDGLEMLVELRREFPNPPVIAMSGHSKKDLMLRAAHGLGAVKIIKKPFESEDLLSLVSDVIGHGSEGLESPLFGESLI